MKPLDCLLPPLREHPDFKLTPAVKYAMGLVCESCTDPYDPLLIRHAVLDVETVGGSLNPPGKLERLATELKEQAAASRPAVAADLVRWLAAVMRHAAGNRDSDRAAAYAALRRIELTLLPNPPRVFKGDGEQLLRTYATLGFDAAWAKATTVEALTALWQIVKYERHSVAYKVAHIADWTHAHDAAIDREIRRLNGEASL